MSTYPYPGIVIRAAELMREVYPDHVGPPSILAGWAVRIVDGSEMLVRHTAGLGRRHKRILKALVAQERAHRRLVAYTQEAA